MSGAGRVRIGISGWRYAPWRGVFYPPHLPQHAELAYAARMFNSIELNGSFYSLQSPPSWRAWYRQTPPEFTFAVKGPRFITHMKRLQEVRAPLANFFASGVLALAEKLGPVLWQLPPQQPFEPERLEAFLALLPRDSAAALRLARGREPRMHGRSVLRIDARRVLRHALEVRHASFVCEAFIALLRRYGVALVVSDSPRRWPQLLDVTADFVYVRLHGAQRLYGSGYGPQALRLWAGRIAAWRRGAAAPAGDYASARRATPGPRDVYAYFDNTDGKLRAPQDARALMELVGAARPSPGRRAVADSREGTRSGSARWASKHASRASTTTR